MMVEINTQMAIQAPPEKIWQVLTDFAHYPAWNPFIKAISGNLQIGQKLQVTIQPPGQKAMRFNPVITALQPWQQLAWKGKLLFPGLLDGAHIFELFPQSDGSTLFVHREKFTGILVGIALKSSATNIQQGFEQMNQQLKLRCEGC